MEGNDSVVYTCDLSRLAIYINSNGKRKTIDDVKLEYDCDAVFNGGFYNLATFEPIFHLKIDGKYYIVYEDLYWGYAWNSYAGSRPVLTQKYIDYDNFICGFLLIKDGMKADFEYRADLAGKRGRTAIGLRADGEFVLFCSADGTPDALTPEQLIDKMYDLGCVSAIMLDGGSSSQCITPVGSIQGGRPYVNNYLVLWAKDKEEGSTEEEDKPVEEEKKYIYKVQTGAFRLKYNANKLRDSLIANGYEGSFVTYIDGYYKVQTGAFSLITNARKMSERLQADGYSTYIVKIERE